MLKYQLVRLVRFFLGTLVVICGLGFAVQAQATVSRVAAEGEQGGCVIKLDASEKHKYRTFSLSNPPRVVVDVEAGAQGGAAVETLKCQLISGIRQSWFDKTRYRFVFDGTEELSIGSYSIGERARGGYVITVVVAGKGAKVPRLPVASEKQEEDESEITELSQLPVVAKPEEKPEAKPEEKLGTKLKTKSDSEEQVQKPVESKPSAKTKVKVSPIIVIDPGHGGVDPGAMGASGVQEKDLVLEFAHELRRALIASGKYKVRMTRQGDVYVKLPERIEKARELEGDLFISIHADAAPERSAKGLSVYTLSEKAADNLSESITANGGSGDFIQGVDLTGKSKEVAGILIDLAERENLNRSAEFANLVIKTMQSRNVKLLNNTHRFAGYVVLKSPDVPAVLLELGFLSNPDDEKKLQSATYRKNVVGGLLKSMDLYFQKNPVYSGQ